jgi:Tol biopolymer transport system component
MIAEIERHILEPRSIFGFAILVSVTLTSNLYAQANFTNWSTPINLGDRINTPFEDRQPAITPNGLSLYFASDRPGGFGGYDLYVSQRATPNDPWGDPENLGPNVNTVSNERAPNFSPCGHWMYLVSDAPGGCGSFDIWVSWRPDTSNDFGWQPAVNLGCNVNSPDDDGGPFYFLDPNTRAVTLFLTSTRKTGLGQPDIYTSALRLDLTFGRAALLYELSTPSDDGRTTIRSDGLEVIFHSDRPGTFGENDLWSSTRETTQDAWSTPVNLGALVNSPQKDAEAALSADGTELYFNSTRPGGFGGRDLYVSRRERL